MKRKGFSLVELICAVAVLALVVVIGNSFSHGRENARKTSCQHNLKMIALALKNYQKDFDDHLPVIAVTNVSSESYPPFGWKDALMAYNGCGQYDQCPSEPHNAEVISGNKGFTDYWFNARLAGLKDDRLAQPAHTITVGDGSDGTENTNARYVRKSIPPNYLPALRHEGGANYGFADGHVKWLVPTKVSTGPVEQNDYTFAPR